VALPVRLGEGGNSRKNDFQEKFLTCSEKKTRGKTKNGRLVTEVTTEVLPRGAGRSATDGGKSFLSRKESGKNGRGDGRFVT